MDAKARAKILSEKAKEQQLVILVYGPGDPGPGGSDELRKYWQKRNQIKEILKDTFPRSEVFFSEDLGLRELTVGLEDLLVEELVHTSIADCILVLDVSRGAHVEVDRFSSIPDIACKMRILIPDRYVGTSGLVSAVHADLRIEGFTKEEFDKCKLATEKCVNLVMSFAYKKVLQPISWS